MHATLYAAAGAMLASTAMSASVGKAVIYNLCNYDVYLSATPAANGGHETSFKTLKSKDSWTQPWTSLTNGQGWSQKLSKTANAFGSNVMQYEYTFHNDGTIWFDMSDVDGNPWDKNWMLTANDNPSCKPKQQAYRYSTDDAYGMQDCGQNTTVAVTLCSGESSDNNLAGTVEAFVANLLGGGSGAQQNQGQQAQSTTAKSTQAISTTQQQKQEVQHTSTSSSVAQAASPTPLTGGDALAFNNGHFEKAAAVAAPGSSTLATKVSSAVVTTDSHGHATTEVVVVTETAIAYKTVVARHPHGHHEH